MATLLQQAELDRAGEALATVRREIVRRELGLPPDPRMDVVIDQLLDFMDEVGGGG